MGHYTLRSREPEWGPYLQANRSSLPLEAFGWPYGAVLAGRMTRAAANEIPRSQWKLPHHWRAGDGALYAHRRGSQLALQALEGGIRGNRVQIPRVFLAVVRAHQQRHVDVIERSDNVATPKKEEKLDFGGVLAMLKDTEGVLDVGAVVAFVEEREDLVAVLSAEVGECEAFVSEVSEVLDIEGGSYEDILHRLAFLEEGAPEEELGAVESEGPDELKGLRGEKTKLLEEIVEVREQIVKLDGTIAHQEASLTSLRDIVEARREKLVQMIIGRMELLKKPETAISRFKTRAEKMTLEDLDAELEETDEAYREAYRIERATVDGKPEEREILWRDLRGYRV